MVPFVCRPLIPSVHPRGRVPERPYLPDDVLLICCRGVSGGGAVTATLPGGWDATSTPPHTCLCTAGRCWLLDIDWVVCVTSLTHVVLVPIDTHSLCSQLWQSTVLGVACWMCVVGLIGLRSAAHQPQVEATWGTSGLADSSIAAGAVEVVLFLLPALLTAGFLVHIHRWGRADAHTCVLA